MSGILQDLGVTILSVILRRIILGKNCTALPLEVGARPSHVDQGGSVLNCYQFELDRLIVLNLKICLNKGNNKITKLRTILQRESQNS